MNGADLSSAFSQSHAQDSKNAKMQGQAPKLKPNADVLRSQHRYTSMMIDKTKKELVSHTASHKGTLLWSLTP